MGSLQHKAEITGAVQKRGRNFRWSAPECDGRSLDNEGQILDRRAEQSSSVCAGGEIKTSGKNDKQRDIFAYVQTFELDAPDIDDVPPLWAIGESAERVGDWLGSR